VRGKIKQRDPEEREERMGYILKIISLCFGMVEKI